MTMIYHSNLTGLKVRCVYDGWISIDRSIQNHWLFKEKKKFSKFEAWIYLLMKRIIQSKSAYWKQIVNVERGQRY
ncbi:hypothetical protein HIL16_16080 [Staphylococcus aureus]|nr:hypothetical protein [Staphylococcus aureus]